MPRTPSRVQSESKVVAILGRSSRSAEDDFPLQSTSIETAASLHQRKLELPAWLQSSGGLVALFCACLVGMIPFCLIACLNLLSIDNVPDEFPDTSVTIPTVAPLPLVSVSDADLMSTLTSFQQDLREQFRLHEAARQASEHSVSIRMKSLEDRVASTIAQQSDTPQVVTRMSSEPFDLADSLGVDWAAWTAGAAIDDSHTSQGLGRSAAGRLARVLRTKFPLRWASIAGGTPQPPEVMLAADSAPPSRCFSFSGNGSVAIRFSRSVQLTHVVLEQLPIWATTTPKAAPRFFEVRAIPAISPEDGYSALLGSFEYLLQGQRAQAFALNAPEGRRWQAVQFHFNANWGDDHTAVCRIRAMGPALQQA